MTAIQAISIQGHEERKDPKPHIVYRIQVRASVRSWQMWRRYSEFVDLNADLTKETGSLPPCTLPPKHALSNPLWRSRTDEKMLQEREDGLEKYLRAILSSKDDVWRESSAFKAFLGVPLGRQGTLEGGSSSEFTSASWLDEHVDLQSKIREIRADVNKRDSLSDRGDVSAAHTTNVMAKKKLAGILTRLGTLTEGVRSLAMGGMSEGEVQRRSDMVARLQDDCEKLSKMLIIARSSTRSSSMLGADKEAPVEARSNLFSGAASTASKPFGRVFGAPAAEPQETAVTRPLDDEGLVQLQQVQMDQQDQQLSQLSSILLRQKQLGLAIHQEVAEQNELLDGLSGDVDRTGTKLDAARKQLRRLE
ncbi:syntaxin [Schizopora paradoxa]|uniref:Syntaxin n=1 Tax=Schizopora paradoxa TaxID=27342 RepID=A0A0H2RX19_9AGAM|nr:syntaxin [Schizopora paradoxa]